MSKSPEEIKQSVLKECGRLFYDPESGANGYKDMGSEPCYRFKHPNGWLNVVVYEDLPTDNVQWNVYYCLLGIEARELEDRLKFTIGKLDEETWERQAAERKVMELEERSQGLVDALEEINEMTTNGPYTLLEAVTAIDMRSKQALNQWKGQPAEAQQ